MSFSLSPGVNVTEIDLTNVIPSVSTTDGALAGDFRWGPCDEVVLVSSENELVNSYGKPDTANAATWFTAASFLAYGNKLRLVRAINEATSKNASSNAGDVQLIKNDVDFETRSPFPSGFSAAKFPGAKGNGIIVSVCPSAAAFRQTGMLTVGTTGSHLSLSSGDVNNFGVGSVVINEVTNEQRTITAVGVPDSSGATLNSAFSVDITFGTPVTVQWQYFEVFGIAPSTSSFIAAKGGSNDEIHVAVVDGSGVFTGLNGQLLEKYQFLSKCTTAKTEDGSANYWVARINQSSKYVRILENSVDSNNITAPYKNADPAYAYVGGAPKTEVMAGGADGNSPSDGDIERGYDLFRNAEVVDVALVITANHSTSVARYVINNLCEYRKDCIALISPKLDSVVNNPDPLPDVIQDREDLQISSSYAVMDANWKFMYDKYNDVYRWVPMNGDIAGLCVRTDTDRDPWWSPAGLNRGQIKNVVKLAYNPDKADRDDLYLKGINPIISIPGQGIVLYGDKTLLGKPSAFDRINVRRLFIVLEKAIALAARFFLFEFNDEFTRAQFKSLVDPYLRSVKAARGIYDFMIVCDDTNNTGEVIDRNEFVGDIYIKPARSINFIQLNFIAVRTGVAFEEVVGKF